MTGTAATEAEEFSEIYGLGVVEIPTNETVARVDEDDQVYRTGTEKYDAVMASIREARERQQPVLVGTTSIDKSEMLSGLLKKEDIPHNVLNARHHEQEALIIAEAGCPGAVTIATNMAGRGTDIQLGGNVEMRVISALEEDPEQDASEIRAAIEAEIADARQVVLDAGGLFVLATERHESRRIDNQLRGRSGRQGDPGLSRFFLSLEDDLMRIFGSDRLDKVLQKLGLEEGEAIVHPWVNKSLEKAQGKVESRNFEIRKQLLKYDDVMNDQRKAIFSQRREIMESNDVSEIVRDMRHELIDDLVNICMPPKSFAEQWEMEQLQEEARGKLGIDLNIAGWADEDGVDDEEARQRLYRSSDEVLARKAVEFGEGSMRSIEKQVLLQTVDSKWREHLVTLEHLRSVIGFRGYAQRDPLNEFKNEAFGLFEILLNSLRTEVSSQISKLRPLTPEEQEALMRQLMARRQATNGSGAAEPNAARLRAGAATAGAAGCAACGRAKKSARRTGPKQPLPVRLRQEIQTLPRTQASDPPAGAPGSQQVRAGDAMLTLSSGLPRLRPAQDFHQSANRPANFIRISASARTTRSSSLPRTTTFDAKPVVPAKRVRSDLKIRVSIRYFAESRCQFAFRAGRFKCSLGQRRPAGNGDKQPGEHGSENLRHAGHHMHIADRKAWRAGDRVQDQIGAFRYPRHPQPGFVQFQTMFGALLGDD